MNLNGKLLMKPAPLKRFGCCRRFLRFLPARDSCYLALTEQVNQVNLVWWFDVPAHRSSIHPSPAGAAGC